MEARLTAVGPLSLGSLILGVSREGGVMPRLQFGAEPMAIASFDLYGGDAGMRSRPSWKWRGTSTGPRIATLPVALDPGRRRPRRRDGGRCRSARLPPGDYVVRGLVRLEDGTAGRVVRTLRKAPR